MRFNSFKLNFPEFQQLKNKYAKYTVHSVFAMVTQWLGRNKQILDNFGKFQ
jgi:nucleoid DNA-binding protein